MAISFGQWTLGLDGGDAPSRDLIGGKASSIARMQALGLDVPSAFVVTTRACAAYLADGAPPARVDDELAAGATPQRRARRLRILEFAPSPPLPPAPQYSRRSRHRGHRPGDGLRQSRRTLRHRRALLAQSAHRRAQALWRVPRTRPGRGCRL